MAGGMMTVEEIKAKLPEANVYELNPDSKYLIVVDRKLVNDRLTFELLKALKITSIGAVLIRTDDPAEAVLVMEAKD